MADEPQFGAELHAETTADRHGIRHDQLTGAFFPQAQHFVVAGGQFKSITNVNNAAPIVPFDFRRIPLGDLDLLNEIRFSSDVVHRKYGRHSVRRLYSARIYGSKSPMTVALYRGDTAEEEWRRDVSQYSSLRHPNLVQLFATASSSGIYAAIFHDNLILAKDLLVKYCGSHFSTVYFWNYLYAEIGDVDQYIQAVLGESPNSENCTIWIRPSTGRLCVDLAPPDNSAFRLYPRSFFFPPSSPLLRPVLQPPENSKIIDSIPLDRYEEICFHHFLHRRELLISTNGSVQLGAVVYCSPASTIGRSKEIAFIPTLAIYDAGWRTKRGRPSVVMESGWTRVNSSDTIHGFFYRSIRRNDWASRGWLAQGGYIFNILDITSNHDDYILVSEIAYELKLFSGCNSIPQGYLFLCPLADLQSDSLSWFRRPECPAYWALDPSGVEHLSAEEAEQLGFPCLELTMMGFGESWDESVYIGSRQLHQAKGFKPDGQDVAWMLGYPLYEIPPGILNPSAHVEETEDFTEDSEVEFNNESPPETNKEESSPGPSLIQASCSRDQAEIPRLSMARKIAIGVHLTLIILSFFSLFEYYRL